MMERRGNRAAIYARISRDKKDEGETLDGQIALCQKLASRYDLEVADDHVFREPDGTGASEKSTAKKRQKYDAMIAAARAAEFDYVLAYADDRLTRRPMELEELITLVEQTGLKIRTVRVENYDLSTAAGVVSARIMSAIAANEARLISERQRVTFERNAYAGKPKIQRQRPFGWEKDGKTIREDEAQLIRSAIQAIKDGAPIASIRDQWNAAGIPTSAGNEWEWSVVHRVLLGWRTVGVRTRHRKPLHDSEGQMVRGTWERSSAWKIGNRLSTHSKS